MTQPICPCPTCGRALADQVRWALVLNPVPLPATAVCSVFEPDSEARRRSGWVEVRCVDCGSERSVYRDYPLASA